MKLGHMVGDIRSETDRQKQHCSPSLILDAQLLPLWCGSSFHQILQLGPLRLSRTLDSTAFGQHHNLQQFLFHRRAKHHSPERQREVSEPPLHPFLPQRWRGRSGSAQSGTVRSASGFSSSCPACLASPRLR